MDDVLFRGKQLALAPMKGLTNAYFRQFFASLGGVNTLYTEFFHISSISDRSKLLRHEIALAKSCNPQVKTVFQLIGSDPGKVRKALKILHNMGIEHVNLNMGCPFGRSSRNRAGGAMMSYPYLLDSILDIVPGIPLKSFSVKIRKGYDSSQDIQRLYPLFKSSAISFIVLHPRLVIDKYAGEADHEFTSLFIKKVAPKPVIVNGDLNTAEKALKVWENTGANGIMIGRWALKNPWIFNQIKGSWEGETFSEVINEDMFLTFYNSLIESLNQHLKNKEKMLPPLKEIFKYLALSIDVQGGLRHELLRSQTFDDFERILMRNLCPINLSQVH